MRLGIEIVNPVKLSFCFRLILDYFGFGNGIIVCAYMVRRFHISRVCNGKNPQIFVQPLSHQGFRILISLWVESEMKQLRRRSRRRRIGAQCDQPKFRLRFL